MIRSAVMRLASRQTPQRPRMVSSASSRAGTGWLWLRSLRNAAKVRLSTAPGPSGVVRTLISTKAAPSRMAAAIAGMRDHGGLGRGDRPPDEASRREHPAPGQTRKSRRKCPATAAWRFLPIPPRDGAPGPSLALHLHQVVKRTFPFEWSNRLGTPKKKASGTRMPLGLVEVTDGREVCPFDAHSGPKRVRCARILKNPRGAPSA